MEIIYKNYYHVEPNELLEINIYGTHVIFKSISTIMLG